MSEFSNNIVEYNPQEIKFVTDAAYETEFILKEQVKLIKSQLDAIIELVSFINDQ